jgi:restriction system protein
MAILDNAEVHRARDIRSRLSDQFNLTLEEEAEMLPSGSARTFDNRVGWALSYLYQAGLIERPRRAHYQITADGVEALAKNPERIDMKVLEAYPKYQEFKQRQRVVAGIPSTTESDKISQIEDDALTPAELIDQAVRTNRAAVEGDLLKAALALDPTGFEDLVIRLLGAMGYGKSGALERTSASGDAGIDGIISQDPLGLDRIYVQAKRYAVDRSIERPKIHEFAGALLGKQGDRGVYITTSSFTRGAREEAERINARIELIDGDRLAALLLKHGVGVQKESTFTIYRLDQDFFDSI